MTASLPSASFPESFISTQSSKLTSESGLESSDRDLAGGGRRREDAGEGGLTGREIIMSYWRGYRVAVDNDLRQMGFGRDNRQNGIVGEA